MQKMYIVLTDPITNSNSLLVQEHDLTKIHNHIKHRRFKAPISQISALNT